MIENHPLPQGSLWFPQGSLGSELMGKIAVTLSAPHQVPAAGLPLALGITDLKILTNRTTPRLSLIARRWAQTPVPSGNLNPVFLIAPFMPRRFPCLGSG